MPSKTSTVRVWDPLVRIGHWTLVVAFFTAYFTGDDFLKQHVIAGYTVGAVIALRLVWGFVGPRHARFSDFVRSPWVAFTYLRDLLARRARHYRGHNPAGGLMIVALLLSLAVTVGSGLMLYANEYRAGPLAGLAGTGFAAPAALSPLSTTLAGEHDEDDDEGGEEFWEELHELAANLTLLLVALHVAGVLLSSRLEGQNLVRAMISGRKRVLDEES